MKRIGRRGRKKGGGRFRRQRGGEGCEGIDIDVGSNLSIERNPPLRYETRRGRGRGRGRKRGRKRERERGVVDIPFEFVGKVAGAGAVAEACDIQGSAAARHCFCLQRRKQSINLEL